MNTHKISMIFASVGIILVVILMITATYAYFSLEIVGEGSDISMTTFNKNVQITYVDTSNVSLTNAYTGESISKTFTVENTGDVVVYYDIKLNDLVNNFANPDDLVFTLSGSNGGAYIKKTTMPVSNPIIASSIKLEPGVKHSYVMSITFLKTDEDQSSNMNKTFSANINISSSTKYNPSKDIYESGTLGSKIVANASSELNLNFSSTSGEGVYYTNDAINGETIYFYRGTKSLNNNVLFAGNCFKIVRTTIDGGIRLAYNGKANNGVCSDTNTAILDTTTKYNNNSNFNAYVGYMYGSADSSAYADEHNNVNSSVIKTALDNWFTANISNYSSYLEDSIYCNNRKTSKFILNNVTYGFDGFSNKNTGYISYKNNFVDMKPTYNCVNKKDKLSVKNSNGVSVLSNSVGLLTSDELTFAGFSGSTSNTTNYLYTSSAYWTMSPAYYNGSKAYNYIANGAKLGVLAVDSTSGIRPVITLKKDTKVISGDGSLSKPYKVTD